VDATLFFFFGFSVSIKTQVSAASWFDNAAGKPFQKSTSTQFTTHND